MLERQDASKMVPVEWVDSKEWDAIELAFMAVEECRLVQQHPCGNAESSGITRPNDIEQDASGFAHQDRAMLGDGISNGQCCEDVKDERKGSSLDEVAFVENEAKRVCRQLPAWIMSPHNSQYRVKAKFPPLVFRGKILYSRTFEEVGSAACELRDAILSLKKECTGKIPLGFDIEWKPTFRRGVPPGKAAVVQLCLDSSRCYVIHIFHSGIPQPLQDLLEDDSICKVGLGAYGDAYKLQLDYRVSVSEIVDLSVMANKKLATFSKKWSLSSLAEELTCKVVEKPVEIRCGDWEMQPLSQAQLNYAATDAFASLHLYQVLASFSDPVTTTTVQVAAAEIQ